MPVPPESAPSESAPPEAVEAASLIDRLARLARDGGPAGGLNPAQWQAMRYLGRANRFSRSPAAVADYLGSTRGTVSQTLISLEQKGYVSRQASPRDKRSLMLELTGRGRRLLQQDPLLVLAGDIAAATGRDAADLAGRLRGVLGAALVRNGGRAFGVCRTCRHFRASGDPRQPHRCSLLDEPLSDADSGQICVEQEAA